MYHVGVFLGDGFGPPLFRVGDERPLYKYTKSEILLGPPTFQTKVTPLHVLHEDQDRTNPFAATRDDKYTMRPFAKLLWTLVYFSRPACPGSPPCSSASAFGGRMFVTPTHEQLPSAIPRSVHATDVVTQYHMALSMFIYGTYW